MGCKNKVYFVLGRALKCLSLTFSYYFNNFEFLQNQDKVKVIVWQEMDERGDCLEKTKMIKLLLVILQSL